MKKPLISLMALAFVGLLFFPDATRGVARAIAGTAGDLAADATASAVVSVNERIVAGRGGAEVVPPGSHAPMSGSLAPHICCAR